MLNGVTMKINTDDTLMRALQEDITSEDVTTNAVMPFPQPGKADLICKEDGVICGLTVFQRVFELLDDTAKFETDCKDGDLVKKGQKIGVIYGDIRALLSGERTALNYLQRMSGIATMTHKMVEELKGKHTKLLDTRKTTPNMRAFEKYAVKVGGGCNHRYNLSDGILIKDNHIGAAGSIKKAVEMAREYAPFVRKIEAGRGFRGRRRYYHAGQYESGRDETGCRTRSGKSADRMFWKCDAGTFENDCRSRSRLCFLWRSDSLRTDYGSFDEKSGTCGRIKRKVLYPVNSVVL